MKNVLLILNLFIYINASSQDISTLAVSPPMGWNSWDCFGMDVTEDQVKATADYMAKHMKKYGWTYIVVDMGWYYGEGLHTSNFNMRNPPQFIDQYGRLIPASRKFPSATGGEGLKPLADYIHSKGLKFGIHIMRGIPWQAVEQNLPIKGTAWKAGDIASEEGACTWYHGMKTVDMTRPGAQEYYDSLMEMYAGWGVDYIKADNMIQPYHTAEVEAINKAIKKTDRPIVLSLSPGPAPVEKADHLKQNAHLWRISGDMWDDWSFIKPTFEYCRIWQNFIFPNHWPDCDMIPIGKLRINGTDGMLAKRLNKTREETWDEFDRLTEDERYTVLTLWYIFRSPLMMGGNVLEYDNSILRLFTNKETLAVNQKSINNRELRADEYEIVWTADDPLSGSRYAALFNVSDNEKRKIRVTWDELGISGKYKVRDLWRKQNMGIFHDFIEVEINPHGSRLFKLSNK